MVQHRHREVGSGIFVGTGPWADSASFRADSASFRAETEMGAQEYVLGE